MNKIMNTQNIYQSVIDCSYYENNWETSRVFVAKQILEFPLLQSSFAVGWDHKELILVMRIIQANWWTISGPRHLRASLAPLHTPLFLPRGSMLQRDDSFLEMGALNTTSSGATLLIFIWTCNMVKEISAKHKVLRFWLNLLPQLA